MHREQTMLFLNNIDYIAQHYPLQQGFLARLMGDFLQQFFYYLVAGPAIVAVLLTLIGVLAYQIVRKFSSRRWCLILAYTVALGVMLWEGGRECLPEYPLASTLQALGWLLLLRLAMMPKARTVRLGLMAGSICLSSWLFGIDNLPGTKPHGKPDMLLEHQLALDIEAAYGHWDKVEELTRDNSTNNIDIYYRNLALAQRNALLERLTERPQNGADGLFMPVDEKGNYFLFSAAGEAWWALGDLTMAEHATMLGMIFSPRHESTRCMRRMAEINLAKGDHAAAIKYIRMLEQSLPHRSWAKKAMAQLENPASTLLPQVCHLREMQATQDTLRLSTQYCSSLVNLLESNPQNLLAQQYLIAYDLLTKDLLDFADDIERCPALSATRVVEEARLIVMASRPEKREMWHDYVTSETWNDFQNFNQAYQSAQGKPSALKKRFGKSFWYYMHFVK